MSLLDLLKRNPRPVFVPVAEKSPRHLGITTDSSYDDPKSIDPDRVNNDPTARTGFTFYGSARREAPAHA